MGFVVAAYAIAIGSLVGYGVWVQLQRRRLARELSAARAGSRGSAGPRG